MFKIPKGNDFLPVCLAFFPSHSLQRKACCWGEFRTPGLGGGSRKDIGSYRDGGFGSETTKGRKKAKSGINGQEQPEDEIIASGK